MAFWSTFGPQLAQSGLHALLGDVVPASAPLSNQSSNGMRGMLGIRNVMGWPGMIHEDNLDAPNMNNPAMGNAAPVARRGI